MRASLWKSFQMFRLQSQNKHHTLSITLFRFHLLWRRGSSYTWLLFFCFFFWSPIPALGLWGRLQIFLYFVYCSHLPINILRRPSLCALPPQMNRDVLHLTSGSRFPGQSDTRLWIPAAFIKLFISYLKCFYIHLLCYDLLEKKESSFTGGETATCEN